MDPMIRKLVSLREECEEKGIPDFVTSGIDDAMRLFEVNTHWRCNSYTMGCQPVRGDNPQALASGLSYMYVQVDKHGITILYNIHQCRPCTSQDISC